MTIFSKILSSLQLGGITIYPLSILFIIAVALIIDKVLFYQKLANFPSELDDSFRKDSFDFAELELLLSRFHPKNCYCRFLAKILQNKDRPLWYIEAQAIDEAKLIEKNLAAGLWILETIITAAPLLGLLGTIFGMMDSFKLIGEDSLVNPVGVTAGVAQALIATAFGLFIAIFSLFAFNYFSRCQGQIFDEMEQLGSKLTNYIRLTRNETATIQK